LFIVDTNGVPSVAPFVRFAAPYEDGQPPSAPTDLSASGTPGSARLQWTASTDDLGVASYNVYRSTSSGFVPSAQNRVGSTSSTAFVDSLLAAGTYYYVVRAVDAAGNVGPFSNEAPAVVTADAVPPTVSLTAPAPAATVSGSVELKADAADDTG